MNPRGRFPPPGMGNGRGGIGGSNPGFYPRNTQQQQQYVQRSQMTRQPNPQLQHQYQQWSRRNPMGVDSGADELAKPLQNETVDSSFAVSLSN